MIEIKNICIFKEAPVIEAMKTIENFPSKIALVISQEGELLGTVTDGDIRRGLIMNISVNDPVALIMNKKPTTALVGTESHVLDKLILKKKISQIPLVDKNNKIMQLYISEGLENFVSKPNTVVLMAGGLGSRLGELTYDCPKPMLKVGDKPILENVIENFKSHGFNRFVISVNYKAEMIEDYFKNGESWDVEISYIKEAFKMGTAGSLTLLNNLSPHPILVMNGDVLTKVNFSQFLDNHNKSKNAATMCVRKFEYQVPFGVVRLENEYITELEEKPMQTFLVSAGIYALDQDVLQLIPKDKYFDMPSLFKLLLAKNKKKTGVFPIHEYWIDVGRKDDFNQAQFDIKKYE